MAAPTATAIDGREWNWKVARSEDSRTGPAVVLLAHFKVIVLRTALQHLTPATRYPPPMDPAERVHSTYAEYLVLEASGETKHEYLRGEVWAMAGGTPEHGRLQANVIRELFRLLGDRPCAVFTSDVRVRIEETDRSTYPDAFVVCGPRRVSPVDPQAITNPTLVVEVLSESTERDDRGEKFAHYRRLASLRDVVFVSQETQRIEVYSRGANGWLLSEGTRGERVPLLSLTGALSVDAVYFDPVAPSSEQ